MIVWCVSLSAQEISIDRDIDRAVAAAFIVLAMVSLYAAIRASGPLIRLELLASIPLNVMASISFLTREPVREGTGRKEIVIPAVSFALPFLVTNNILLFPVQWSTDYGLVIAVPGILLACASLIVLRRSFSILPAVRAVTSSGPYRWVRHPLYLGESVYLVGMMLLAFNALSVLLLVVSFVLLVARIGIEERKLSSYQEYRDYMRAVRFKLVPGLF
jgi:protein-S-isoprenylcysteine O-methyltransferase Ste14